jgi:EmrB/QacA subfamily drug resistance transporter
MSTSAAAPRSPAHVRHPGIALMVIVTVQLMVVLDATVVNIALPKIQTGLHFSPAGLSWVINAYTLAFGGLLLLGGRAGDVFGRRRMFLGGVVLFTAASLVGGLSTSAAMLVIARATQGIGAAAAAPSALALLVASFAEGSARNRALGVFTAVSSGGASVGLILGGALTAVSWRWVLFINVPIGLLVLALGPRFLADTDRNRSRLDVPGAVASIVGMGSLVYGLIRTGSDGWGNPVALAALGIGVAVMAGFVALEIRAESPIVPLRLFRDRNRAGAYAIMLLLPSAMFGMFFFLTQYLQEAKGYSPLRTGFAFLPMTLLIFTASRIVPQWMPRIGARRLLIVGLTLLTIGMIGLTRVTPTGSYATHELWPMLLVGTGIGCSFMPVSATILAGVRREDSGAASSLLQTMQQVGGTVGLAALVTVFGIATHHATLAAGARHLPLTLLTHGDRIAFIASVAFAAIAFVVAVVVLRTPPAADVEAVDVEMEHLAVEMV